MYNEVEDITKTNSFLKHRAVIEELAPQLIKAKNDYDRIRNSEEWVQAYNYFQVLGNRGILKSKFTFENGYKIDVVDERKQKLIDVISKEPDVEWTVYDRDYDIEVYFYYTQDKDAWDEDMMRLASLLDVDLLMGNNKVVVNLSELIENRLGDLEKADLFIDCTVDSIIDSIEYILAGNVSEEWFKRFVDSLEGRTEE